jgi:predicted AlkP superfamily pyrophosphatase or phosphodiesterase
MSSAGLARGAAALLVAAAGALSCAWGKVQLPSEPLDSAEPERILLVVIDAANERVFRSLLERGALPHIAALLAPDAAGGRRGVYTAASSVWPSTTGPAYPPFFAGIFPEKSRLAGIRQYLRRIRTFRSYAGSDAPMIAEDVSREFPLIFEVLDREETFNQAGFVTRRGWNDAGDIRRPLHENLSSTPGLMHSYVADASAADLYNALSFLNYVSPEFDTDRLRALDSFQGRYFDWSVSLGTARIAYEEAFGLMGLERVVREMNLGARRLGRLPEFSYLGLHLPDPVGHGEGMGRAYEESLERVDEILGFMFAVFREQGVMDGLTLIITADHGLSPVDLQVPLIERLALDTGLAIHDSIRTMTDGFNRSWRGSASTGGEERRFVGIGAVSGNAHVQIYLRAPGQADWTVRPRYDQIRAYPRPGPAGGETGPVDLVDALRRYPEVGLVCVAEASAGRYHVFSRAGEAVIETRELERGRRAYRYGVRSGTDPLSYASRPETAAMMRSGRYFDGDAWAAASRDTGYPDALVQIVQLLETETAGDLLVDAAPGVEPWDQGQRAVHGALRREEIVVPLVIHGPALDVERAELLFARGRLPRTVDIYPTLLELLGRAPPRQISWSVRKWLGLGREKRTVAVRTDIDGVALDIWRD